MSQSFNNKFKQLSHSLYPWLVISLCSIFLFYKYVLQVSPSVMTSNLMQFFQLNGTGLGNLAAVFFYTFLIIQLVAGPLIDKYSPRKLMSFAIFCCALGTLIFATSHVLFIAIIGRALVGVGAAFATVGYMKLASVYFPPERFALVGGFLATAAMIGAMLGETPIAYAVDSIGWRQCLLDIAFMGVVISILFFVLVRDKKNSPTQVQNKPLEWSDFLVVLKKKENWLLAFYSGLAFEPLDVFAGLWGNPFLQSAYHLSRTETSSYISCVFLGLAVGSPVLGWLSDRLRNRLPMMILGCAASLFFLILIIYVAMPLWLLGAMLFSFGFATGAFMLGFAMGTEINLAALAATIVALINTGDAIFGAVTEPLIGKFLDMSWNGKMVDGVRYFSANSFHEALSLLVLYLVVALILLFFIRKNSKPVLQ